MPWATPWRRNFLILMPACEWPDTAAANMSKREGPAIVGLPIITSEQLVSQCDKLARPLNVTRLAIHPMHESQCLYERIAQELAEAIARGEFAIGQLLPSERDLAQKFGVSRPTVREAMIALELDGLVDVKTGSGVYVTHRSPPAGVTGKRDIDPLNFSKRAVPSKVRPALWQRRESPPSNLRI